MSNKYVDMCEVSLACGASDVGRLCVHDSMLRVSLMRDRETRTVLITELSWRKVAQGPVLDSDNTIS